ncbi:MAG: DNA recombination protein RmuC [Eubacteriales bacterium]|nr:DNA recombination protein RmuC [Eubacteriales bacterium]
MQIPWMMWILLGLCAAASLIACIAAVAALRRGRQDALDARDTAAQLERLERLLREENERSRAGSERQSLENREEMARRIESLRRTVEENLVGFTSRQGQQMEQMRQAVERRLETIQQGNEKKLDEMRGVVDEKLTATLETKLGQSFKMVSDQLEQVYKNLGEMRSLSKDMGDIKSIFSNVKTRGTWGEVQLGALLESMLTAEQFQANVKIRPTRDDIVEFAVKLPGPDEGSTVWLPLDSKFPMEDYQRLVQAQESHDPAAAAEAEKALEVRVLSQARTIRDKYIQPPYSTDFAVLFVPVESLFAEILRRPGLCERIQQECRVTVAGPTTLSALLNSLRMGFRTLAIQKRSGEVWKLLGAVKKQFGSFADTLGKIDRNLELASKSVRDAASRTNMIQRRLDKVEELPAPEAESLLPMEGLSSTMGEGEA